MPVSASVVAPTGPAQRTPAATQLKYGESAFLPANAFRPNGQLAMFTVTGIEPGVSGELPESVTHGGVPFYVHVTVTQLGTRQLDVPSTVGLAGSADGRTATLTETPPDGFDKCVAATAPKELGRGNSFATCFVAVADPDTDVSRVVYWAQTTTDPEFDYKAAPVVWSDGSAVPAASPSAPAPTS
ncbi:hypothetical protein GCM10007298_33180 [Williamsia phyllosphaerae]|uniref:Uncharacterized protein n=1 Tax=Williamsia phyllosphaerae TaxID=885042 RepID=A0ABQ1V1P4_9NOCA|nr:hypothetical protein GCM10007298_33180 [Williamsia phyllosphaerae]